MSTAVTLLALALSLLQQVQSNQNLPPELRQQAISVATYAITYANQNLGSSQPTAPISNPAQPVTPAYVAPQSSSQTAPTQTAPEPVPVSQARIEIVNNTNDLSRKYTAMPSGCKLIIGSNYNDVDCSPAGYPSNGDVTLKAVLYNADGSVNQNATMQITATDDHQNKTFNGTGDIVTFYKDGQKQQVYGYVYGYHFLSRGTHAITFRANGLEKAVALDAQ